MEKGPTIGRQSFKMVRRIGEGGYGVTYLVENKNTKTRYIAKRLKKSTGKKELETQFKNLQAVKTQCDKYFVCPYRIMLYKGSPILLMEYLEGYVDLFEYLANPTVYKRSHESSVKIAKNLIKGLRAMHQLQVAHRDIKPENIMINPKTLQVRYIDFGLACVGDQECRSKPIMAGTRNYLAPEIVLNPRHVRQFSLEQMKKTDLYSLGIVIGLLLHPTEVANPVLLQVQQRKFPDTRSLYTDILASSILREMNQKYITKPLGDPSIILLEMDPSKRTLGVPKTKAQQQEQQRKQLTTRMLEKKAFSA